MFHTRFTEILGSKDYISKVLTADRRDTKSKKKKSETLLISETQGRNIRAQPPLD